MKDTFEPEKGYTYIIECFGSQRVLYLEYEEITETLPPNPNRAQENPHYRKLHQLLRQARKEDISGKVLSVFENIGNELIGEGWGEHLDHPFFASLVSNSIIFDRRFTLSGSQWDFDSVFVALDDLREVTGYLTMSVLDERGILNINFWIGSSIVSNCFYGSDGTLLEIETSPFPINDPTVPPEFDYIEEEPFEQCVISRSKGKFSINKTYKLITDSEELSLESTPVDPTSSYSSEDIGVGVSEDEEVVEINFTDVSRRHTIVIPKQLNASTLEITDKGKFDWIERATFVRFGYNASDREFYFEE